MPKILQILQKNNLFPNTKIHEIILHVHSRIDICNVCAVSLSSMCQNPRGFIEQFKKALISYGYKGPEAAKENQGIQFLLLASSREILTTQDRRMSSGHDGEYHRLIDAATFPPYFTVKVIEPFLRRGLPVLTTPGATAGSVHAGAEPGTGSAAAGAGSESGFSEKFSSG